MCCCCFFFFNDSATTEIYTLSLHDALPIFEDVKHFRAELKHLGFAQMKLLEEREVKVHQFWAEDRKSTRLNSSHLGISYAVFCLKKKKQTHKTYRLAPLTERR